LNKHSAVLGSWDLLVVGLNYGFQKFGPCRFESIAPPLRNVGVKVAKFGGTAYHPRLPSTQWYQLSAGLEPDRLQP
jgi:hypothetical protein